MIQARLRMVSCTLLAIQLVIVEKLFTQDRLADITANKWLGASGAGLRFASPIGPIRFDVGWKWKKRDPDDKRYAFFFTFGHAF